MKLALIIVAANLLMLYGGLFQKEWALYAGCFPIVLITLYFALFPSKDNGEESLQQIEKEMGLKPYTEAEKSHFEQEEREHYNQEESANAFWAGSDTYVDFDGLIRDVTTHKVVGFSYKRKKKG